MAADCPTVFVIDDEVSIRKALSRLLSSAGFRVLAYASPTEFLAGYDPLAAGCLILDVAMPDGDGLDLQQQLVQAGCPLPIIFLSGHGDIPISVRAMRAGALDFLTKPVGEEDLLRAVNEALRKDAVARRRQAEAAAVGERFASLTQRERQVLEQVVAGRLNKQIAADLGIVEKTVKVHRARLMEKSGAGSLAELVRMAERLGTNGQKD